jgi:hypothetical protein
MWLSPKLINCYDGQSILKNYNLDQMFAECNYSETLHFQIIWTKTDQETYHNECDMQNGLGWKKSYEFSRFHLTIFHEYTEP